jgi:hypothetical protein
MGDGGRWGWLIFVRRWDCESPPKENQLGGILNDDFPRIKFILGKFSKKSAQHEVHRLTEMDRQ